MTLTDPARPLVRGRVATYWRSHSPGVLHQWWCRRLETAPDVRPLPALEGIVSAEVVASMPRRRLCGECLYRADA